MEHSAF